MIDQTRLQNQDPRLLVVSCQIPETLADSITDMFLAHEAEGAYFTILADEPAAPVMLTAYFPEQDQTLLEHALKSVLSRILAPHDLEQTRLTILPFEQSPVAADWRSRFPPREAGATLLVVPDWWQGTSTREIIRILPGSAFGTGQHESTLIALELMANLLEFPTSTRPHGTLPGDNQASVLQRSLPVSLCTVNSQGISFVDVGSGSGILAIAAVRLGLHLGVAVEIDEVAFDNFQQNLNLNEMSDRIFPIIGSVAAIHGRFPLILANLEEAIFRSIASDLVALLAPDGAMIISGLTEATVSSALTLFSAYPLSVRKRLNLNGWVGMVLQFSECDGV